MITNIRTLLLVCVLATGSLSNSFAGDTSPLSASVTIGLSITQSEPSQNSNNNQLTTGKKGMAIAWNCAKIIAGGALAKLEWDWRKIIALAYHKETAQYSSFVTAVKEKKSLFTEAALCATALGLICDGGSNLYNLLWKKEEPSANKAPEAIIS